MVNLKSQSLCVLERDTGRRIRVNIADFPYTLIWSTPQKPMRFICVEPWHSIPGEDDGPIEWEQKPCAAALKRAKAGRPRWIWRLNGKRRPEAAALPPKSDNFQGFAHTDDFCAVFHAVKKEAARPLFRLSVYWRYSANPVMPCNPFTFTLNAPPLAESVCPSSVTSVFAPQTSSAVR